MTLEEARIEIDKADREITRLLTARLDAVREVALYKLANHLPVHAPEREAAVLDKVSALTTEEYAPYIRMIYQGMFEASKAMEQKLIDEAEK